MLDLIIMINPLKILGFVIFFLMIQMDNKVVTGAGLFAEVLCDQPMDVVILPCFFTSDSNAGITLCEAWLQDISFIQFGFKTYNTAFV